MQISVSSRKDTGNGTLLIINLIGIALSTYAHHVNVSKKAEANYQALCDLMETMSCSSVLTSRFSAGFGIMNYFVDESSAFNPTNSAIGIVFYSFLALLSQFQSVVWCKVFMMLAIVSNFGSIYLGTVLIFLKNACIVCISTYVVNALNLYFSYKKLNILKENAKLEKDK